MLRDALWLSLAAAATTVIPPAATRQIAWWSGSLLVRPQLWSSAAGLGDAHVDRLEERPARVVRVALGEDPVEAADVPRDQAVAVVVEDLDAPHARARGDTDDAEAVVEGRDRAGDVRAVVVLVAPGRAVRGRAVVAAGDVEVGVRGDAGVDDRDVGVDPLVGAVDAARVLIRPPTRETPVGIVWVRWTTSSGTTATTFGSARRSRFCFLSSLAEKPRNARVKDRSAVTPSRLRTFETTAAVSVPLLSMTMKRPVGIGGALGGRARPGRRRAPVPRLGSVEGSTEGSVVGASVGVASVGVGSAVGAGSGGVGSGVATGASVGSLEGDAVGSAALTGATTGRAMSTARNRGAIRRCIQAICARSPSAPTAPWSH